ncbi:Lipoprotein NlpE [Methylophilaceae bacterium]|nr:Lipoprotein NlpE [Methylophilaceae bacterium]
MQANSALFLGVLLFGLSLGACTHVEPAADAHNSRNSLDWAGSYHAVLPCADCEGIDTTLTLNDDLSYQITTQYLGKHEDKFRKSGRFSWNEAGSAIVLHDYAAGPDHYQVGENHLRVLDKQGQRIDSRVSDYILHKQAMQENSAADALAQAGHWRLVELMGKSLETGRSDSEASAKAPTLKFDVASSRISGFSGCNRYSGQYALGAGQRLRFSGIAATQMACLDTTVESEYLKSLNMTDSYYLVGNRLQLNRARMRTLAVFEAVSDQP